MLVIWFYFILFFGVISSFLFCELIDRIRVTSYLSKTIVVIRSRMVAWCVAPILVLWIYFKLFIMHSVKYIYVASLWHLHLVFFFFFSSEGYIVFRSLISGGLLRDMEIGVRALKSTHYAKMGYSIRYVLYKHKHQKSCIYNCLISYLV